MHLLLWFGSVVMSARPGPSSSWLPRVALDTLLYRMPRTKSVFRCFIVVFIGYSGWRTHRGASYAGLCLYTSSHSANLHRVSPWCTIRLCWVVQVRVQKRVADLPASLPSLLPASRKRKEYLKIYAWRRIRVPWKWVGFHASRFASTYGYFLDECPPIDTLVSYFHGGKDVTSTEVNLTSIFVGFVGSTYISMVAGINVIGWPVVAHAEG